MTDHPITPPPKLVKQWLLNAQLGEFYGELSDSQCYTAIQAARWGADQELEACCEVLARELICDGKHVATDLRTARRPKPPSLAEEALSALYAITSGADDIREFYQDVETVKAALERLQKLEQN